MSPELSAVPVGAGGERQAGWRLVTSCAAASNLKGCSPISRGEPRNVFKQVLGDVYAPSPPQHVAWAQPALPPGI